MILENFNKLYIHLSSMTDINKVISKDIDFRSRDYQSESSLNLQQPIKIKIYGTHKMAVEDISFKRSKEGKIYKRYIRYM